METLLPPFLICQECCSKSGFPQHSILAARPKCSARAFVPRSSSALRFPVAFAGNFSPVLSGMCQQCPPRALFLTAPAPVCGIAGPGWEMQVAAQCSCSDLAFPGTAGGNCPVLASGFSPLLMLRHLGILQAQPGSWQPLGRMGGRQGGLQGTEAVPQLGRKMNDLGHNSCPLRAASKQSLQLHSCRCTAQLHCWSQGEGSWGMCHHRTLREGAICASAPIPHPCPGSCVPCQDKDRLP